MSLEQRALLLADQIEAYADSPSEIKRLIVESGLIGNEGTAVKAANMKDASAKRLAGAVGGLYAKILRGEYSLELVTVQVRKLRINAATLSEVKTDEYAEFYQLENSDKPACFYRDKLFVHLANKGKGPAAIRDHWNQIKRSTRELICPSNPSELKGDAGRRRINEAIKRFRRNHL